MGSQPLVCWVGLGDERRRLSERESPVTGGKKEEDRGRAGNWINS